MKYDITVKELFAGSEQPLVEYFTGIDLENIRPLNVEFQRVEARASDLVVEGYVDSDHVVVHIEFQSTNDPRMHWRMLRYALEIYEAYNLPVYQLLLYIGAKPVRMKDRVLYDSGEFGKLDYRYRLMDIGSFTRRALISAGIPELYAFLPLAERKARVREPERFLEGCISDIIRSEIGFEEKRKTLLRAEIFAGLAFEKGTVERIFREAEDMLDLTQSTGYQRIIEKGIQQGIEQGRKEGIQRGIQQGKKEALLAVTLNLLRRKFKELPEEYMARIQGQDIPILERIANDIFEIEKLEDLGRYLD